MSKAKVDEWLHADKGSPWKRRAEGGGLYDMDKPTISRDWDAEILSKGRRQSPDLDNNLTPVPDIAPLPRGTDNAPWMKWMPQPIPVPRLHKGEDSPANHRAARGGGIAVRRDLGGGIDVEDNPGALVPTSQNQNPMQQNALQTYAQMPPEKLEETLARLGGPSSPQGALVARVLKQKQMQSAQSLKRGGVLKRDMGGMMPGAALGAGGFLHGTTPGRADKVQTSAPGGSYIVPADVIAGLGQGNSLAGARVMDAILGSGPHGISLPRGGGGRGAPRPPAPVRAAANGGPIQLFPERRAAGGVKGKQETPVLLSHGEYSIAPHHCERIGTLKGVEEHPDVRRRRGHSLLDRWVVDQRKKQVREIKNLPPPVKT